MGFLIILAALWLAIFSGCTPSVSAPKGTQGETVREQPAPFAGKEKTEVPVTAKAHAHLSRANFTSQKETCREPSRNMI